MVTPLKTSVLANNFLMQRLYHLLWAAASWSLPCGRRSVTRPVPVNRIALWILLWFGVSTIWVEGHWAVSLLEAATFLWVATHIRKFANPHWSVWCLAGVAAWGILQIALHQTVSPADTESATLYWLAAACWVALGALIRNRESFLDGLLWFGAALSVLELAQLYTSHGQILWFIPTEESKQIFGTFPNYNHYAAFIELLFPLALWRSFRDRARGWIYAVVAAIMYGSVVAAASRAGTILVTLELAAVIALMARRNFQWRLVLVLSGIAAFALAAGPETVWRRLLAPDPYAVRREYLESAMAMFRARPLAGFGLGTWTSAYPAYAVADFGVIANHAHSEWGQWAAEGGLAVVATLGALFVLAVRKGFQTVWAMGLAAVMLHAIVDYPLVRLGLGCWWFVLFGLAVREESVRDERWTLQPPQ
jgi:O-antigen ligase